MSLDQAALSQAETPRDLLRAMVATPAAASCAASPEPASDDALVDVAPATLTALTTLVDVLV